MKKFQLFVCFLCCFSVLANAQNYTSSSIFAHNDYKQPIPFYTAYAHQVGYIEADVLLQKQSLFVAHEEKEISKERTLEALYLEPLRKVISQNNGYVYPDREQSLMLMIDIKTAAEPTLRMIVKKLKEYPDLLACPTFQVGISGNRPEPASWQDYPAFIHFDGRPGVPYTDEQWNRISLVSTSFRDQVQWNGKGVPTSEEKEKLVSLIKEVHNRGKKIRFWAMPDFTNAWIQMMQLKVDVLNTDQVPALATFLEDLPRNTFRNKQQHQVYVPTQKSFPHEARPKNIILMIGDGMGLTQLFSGYMANFGHLSLFNISDIGFSITTTADHEITDSAAGATAMATGQKTKNRHIGVDSLGDPLLLITQKLKQNQYKTAIITSGDVTDATPAAFYAHQPERSMNEAIAADFLQNNQDVLIGGGISSFNKRKDGKNLMEELDRDGYAIFESIQAVYDSDRIEKLIVLDDAATLSAREGRGDFFLQAVKKSLNLLTDKPAPFFIMAEGAQIDWGGHRNEMDYVVREVLDFDKAVGEMMKFVEEDGQTLLIVTADHETGGLSLLGGNVTEGYVHGHFSTTDHTGVMVPVLAYGPGSHLFRGVYQNTEIYHKILSALNFQEAKVKK